MQSRYLIARKSFQFSVLANFFIDGWDSNFLRRRRFFFSLKLFGEQFLIEGVGITFPFLEGLLMYDKRILYDFVLCKILHSHLSLGKSKSFSFVEKKCHT